MSVACQSGKPSIPHAFVTLCAVTSICSSEVYTTGTYLAVLAGTVLRSQLGVMCLDRLVRNYSTLLSAKDRRAPTYRSRVVCHIDTSTRVPVFQTRMGLGDERLALATLPTRGHASVTRASVVHSLQYPPAIFLASYVINCCKRHFFRAPL